MTWLLNELAIVYFRARLWLALRESEKVLGLCDKMLDAKAKRPAWLSDWLDEKRR